MIIIYSFESFLMKVTFSTTTKTIKQVIELINSDPISAQLIFWYVGPHGFKLDGVKYYQKIFRSILSTGTKNITLYDMSAWATLLDQPRSIDEINTCVDQIETFGYENVSVIRSGDYFKFLLTQFGTNISDFLSELFSRDILYAASKQYRPSGFTFSEHEQFTGLKSYAIHTVDTGKSYSVLQYIEAIYLIEHMILSGSSRMYFVLPNDELKYYNMLDGQLFQMIYKII